MGNLTSRLKRLEQRVNAVKQVARSDYLESRRNQERSAIRANQPMPVFTPHATKHPSAVGLARLINDIREISDYDLK